MPQYTMRRGTTFGLDTTFYRGVDARNNKKPIDLTGAVVTMTAKKALGDDDSAAVWFIKSPVDIAIVDPPTQGRVLIRAPAAATSGLPPTQDTRLFYDIKIFEADGTESIPEYGEITVQATATRAVTPP